MCGEYVINMKRKAATPSEYKEYKKCLFYEGNSETATFFQGAQKTYGICKNTKNMPKRTY